VRVALFANDQFGSYVLETVRTAPTKLVCVVGETRSVHGQLVRKLRQLRKRPHRVVREIRQRFAKDDISPAAWADASSPGLWELCRELDVPIYENYLLSRPSFARYLRSLDLDLILVTTFAVILSRGVIDVPARGVVNLHFSLLPAYRGLTPEICCLLDGMTQTGVTVHFIDDGIDTGKIIEQRQVSIAPDDDLFSLQAKLFPLGRDLVRSVLSSFATGSVEARPQDESQATSCRLPAGFNAISCNMPGTRIRNILRACLGTPFVPYVERNDGRRIYLLDAEFVSEPNRSEAPGVIRLSCTDGELIVRRAWMSGGEL